VAMARNGPKRHRKRTRIRSSLGRPVGIRYLTEV
jgi:hypothetical protein